MLKWIKAGIVTDSVAPGDLGHHGDHHAEVSDIECGICKESIRNSTEPVEALFCGHVFHSVCINNVWTVGRKERGSCPYRCRQVVTVTEGDALGSDGGGGVASGVDGVEIDLEAEIAAVFNGPDVAPESLNEGAGNPVLLWVRVAVTVTLSQFWSVSSVAIRIS